MVTVYIWDPSTTGHGWGHAAIEVEGQFLSIGSSKDRQPVLPALSFTHDKLYTSKMRFWNDHSGWPHTYEVHLTGLDEEAMVERIWRFRREEHQYHTLVNNCARAVWEVLEAGLDDDPDDEYALLNDNQAPYYSPMALLQYVRDIAAGLI